MGIAGYCGNPPYYCILKRLFLSDYLLQDLRKGSIICLLLHPAIHLIKLIDLLRPRVGRNGGFPVPGVSGDERLEGTPARAARVKDRHRYSGGSAVQDPDG